MELFGLDASRATIKALNCINIQWNRRYYEAGDYALQLQDWDSRILFTHTSPKLAWCKKSRLSTMSRATS